MCDLVFLFVFCASYRTASLLNLFAVVCACAQREKECVCVRVYERETEISILYYPYDEIKMTHYLLCCQVRKSKRKKQKLICILGNNGSDTYNLCMLEWIKICSSNKMCDERR